MVRGEAIDVREIVRHPLLLPNPSFATRTTFDAACRLAGMAATRALVESRAAHGLLTLAQAGQGVAVGPSILRPDRKALNVMAVTHLGKPLRISLAVLWDGRCILPRYAEGFTALPAQHVQESVADPLFRRPGRPSGVARPAPAGGAERSQ